jgi:hypothetical protein
MTMRGQGAVAIWHDITPEGRSDFYAWHGQEHMPERVAIPGFIRGRRWLAIDADREFFNLYETRDPGVVKGPDYKARLDAPTPWTLRTVANFRKVARSLCTVEASTTSAATIGADGGTLATIRYDLPPDRIAAHLTALRETLIPALAATVGIAAVHLIAADLEASGYVNAEQRARGDANEIPTHALLIEGWADETGFITGVQAVLAATVEVHRPEGALRLGYYRHQITTWKVPGD